MQFARGSFSEKIVYLGNEDEYDHKYYKIIVSVRPSFIFFISSRWAFKTRVGFFRNEFYRNLSAGGYKLNTFSIDILNIGVGLTYFHPKNFIRQVRALFLNFVKARNHRACGMYLKKSEPILLTGSAGGRAKTEPPFRPTTPKSGSGKNDFKFFAGDNPQGKS